MNVSLTPELEEFVAAKVEGGRYRSASEVVREALRLLEEYDQVRANSLQGLRSDLQLGLAQLDRGEGITHTDESLGRLMEGIKRRGRQRLAAGKAVPG
jgi:antitoxin ParD1/3/4